MECLSNSSDWTLPDLVIDFCDRVWPIFGENSSFPASPFRRFAYFHLLLWTGVNAFSHHWQNNWWVSECYHHYSVVWLYEFILPNCNLHTNCIVKKFWVQYFLVRIDFVVLHTHHAVVGIMSSSILIFVSCSQTLEWDEIRMVEWL